MVKRLLYASAIVASLLGLSSKSFAATCTFPVNQDKFDADYSAKWTCDQANVNEMVADFEMDEGNWDDGFGWADACNNDLPLKRTFNALQVLRFAVTATPNCSDTLENVGIWSYCYAKNAIDELDAECGDGSARAMTHHGIDDYTELYLPFFYDESVVQRAGTIFHEARHAGGWCSHTDGCIDGNGSCDPSWSDGCVGFGSGSGRGANAYTVLFAHWFATTAREDWTNPTIRESAVAEGNRYLTNRFETDPCFRLDASGDFFAVCTGDYPAIRLYLNHD